MVCKMSYNKKIDYIHQTKLLVYKSCPVTILIMTHNLLFFYSGKERVGLNR